MALEMTGSSPKKYFSTAPPIDMSNRPDSPASGRHQMSTIVKFAMMIFVSMLCLVALMGGVGLLMAPKKEAAQANPEASNWVAKLTDGHLGSGSPPLLYLDAQMDLERPVFKHTKRQIMTPDDPFAEIAQANLNMLSSLRARNLTFIIHVIGWRRRASLKRLVTSLEQANYLGFNVRLHFHLDGEAHELVKEYVEEYDWPHGKTMMNIHTERLGLESTIVNAWDARSDNQFAFFFEDDIEASPHFFEYSLLVLQKYIFPDPNGPRLRSFITDKMIGIALNTPRFNEIVFPPYRWVPQHVIGQEAYQFAFQLPNSWGCMYFPWAWRAYREYYAWRKKTTEIDTYYHVVPDSFINNWVRSWKKYLIELAYLRGYYMIHPNLPGQHGFSIHHRERGEHTTGRGEAPIVDDLGDLYLDYFTIPLVTNKEAIHRLYATMKPLQELPVVNFHHSKVKDIYALAQGGYRAVAALEPFGYDFQQGNPNPGCILDNVSPPVENIDVAAPKFLLYEGQGSLYDQMQALESAFAYAKVLNRTLILPPVSQKQNGQFATSNLDLLQDVKALKADPWAPCISWEGAGTDLVWVDRIVAFEAPQGSQFGDKLLDRAGIVPMQEVALPRAPSTSEEVLKSFGMCHDTYLTFRSLSSAFRHHSDPVEEKAYRKWTLEKLGLRDTLQELFKMLKTKIPGPVGCVAFTRGDDPSRCGLDGTFPTEDIKKMVSYRSCVASAPRTIEYLLESAKQLGVSLGSIYVLTDERPPPETIPRATEISKGVQIPIIRSSMVTETIIQKNLLHPEIKDLFQDVRRLFERQLCLEAAVFEGNQFSTFSVDIGRAREVLGKPTSMLGHSAKAAS